MKSSIIPTVNLHLTKNCNMKCKYCFAGFNQMRSEIDKNETVKLLSLLREAGIQKINFVGGEPLLIKKLPELIRATKNMGFYTTVVTNGSLISDKFLRETAPFIDQIGISIDSLNKTTNKSIGRNSLELTPDKEYYISLIEKIYSYGIEIKINTVVSQFNINEPFYKLMNMPEINRWKVFQVLKIENENASDFESFKISQDAFDNFCIKNRHKLMYPDKMICENNNIMQGSYLMINPEGKFFDNTKGSYTVSEKITTVGVKQALSDIKYNFSKFINREGYYYHKNISKNQAS